MNQNVFSNPRHPKRVYRDISQKYCSRLDDIVIVVKNASMIPEQYECLSAHLCGSHTDEARGIISNCSYNI
jgi:hypothetical protein